MYSHAPTTHTNPTEPTTRIGDGYFIVIFVENFMVKLWVKISRNFQTIYWYFSRKYFSHGKGDQGGGNSKAVYNRARLLTVFIRVQYSKFRARSPNQTGPLIP